MALDSVGLFSEHTFIYGFPLIYLFELVLIPVFLLYVIYLFITGRKGNAKSLLKPSKTKVMLTVGLGLVMESWTFVMISHTLVCPDVPGAHCSVFDYTGLLYFMFIIHLIAIYFLSSFLFRGKE